MPKRLNDKTRYIQRKRYYAKHRKNKKNARNPWSLIDEKAVLERKISDVALSEQIGRSVEAIQVRRCILLKIKKD